MAMQKFFIGPYQTGLENDVKPISLPEDAFAQLNNAYVWRERVRKRFGSYLINQSVDHQLQPLYSRLRIKLTVPTAAVTGNAAGMVPGAKFKVGQQFSIGTTVYTVTTAGAVQPMIQTHPYIGDTSFTAIPSGNLTTNTLAIWAGPYAIGQVFTVQSEFGSGLGTETFTITSVAAGAQILTASGTGSGTFDATTGALIITSPSTVSATYPAASVYFNPNTTATYSTTNGAYNFVGAPVSTDIYFYPAQPVMGIWQYQGSADVNDIPTYAFDTQFAYQRSAGGWNILGAVPPAANSLLMTSGNANFVWACNWRGATNDSKLLFITNNNDNINYWNGAQWAATMTTFVPELNKTTHILLQKALILIPFKDRLVALNTTEGVVGGASNLTYQNRARYSQNGDPLDLVLGWEETTPGRGGYIDAPTKEPITSAQIYKDRLIVFFSNSTWELVYTQNQILPFVWQQINVELGAESTFATIPFNDGLLSVGNVGVHVCNGGAVERIDSKIPDEVFNIHNETDAIIRVHGIRDYFLEMAYWTFPSTNDVAVEYVPVYPNKILVYNYKNKSWAFNDDSVTAFGYWQQQTDITWGDMESKWEDAEMTWNSPVLTALFREILAGNQEGYTFILSPDLSRNAPALSISYIDPATQYLTIIDHNLKVGDFVLMENVLGTADVIAANDHIFPVGFIVDKDTLLLNGFSISGSYYGGGTLARVSKIDILTKEYNFFKDGRNMYMEKVDCYVDRTATGQLSFDAYTSTSNTSQLADAATTGTLLGTNILETTPYTTVTYEQTQERLWHSIYLNAEGNTVQLEFYLSDAQMGNSLTYPALEPFVLYGMMFYAMPTTPRLT